MRPAPFEYAAPASLEEALSMLAEGGDEATVIAGGQSLLPVMRMRLGAPELVVDLRMIEELRAIREDGDDLVIGAMATHHAVAHDPAIARDAALLAQAAATVGDPQIRYRGTIGGSLAHADPAGDLGPAALAVDARLEIAGPSGRRVVSADEFFTFYFTTALEPGEILTGIRVPRRPLWRARYEKFTLVAQSWSIVAVGVALLVEGDTITQARVGMANMASTPLRATAAEEALTGCPVDRARLTAAAALAGRGTEPPTDAAGTPQYRRHLAGVLATRATLAATQA